MEKQTEKIQSQNCSSCIFLRNVFISSAYFVLPTESVAPFCRLFDHFEYTRCTEHFVCKFPKDGQIFSTLLDALLPRAVAIEYFAQDEYSTRALMNCKL